MSIIDVSDKDIHTRREAYATALARAMSPNVKICFSELEPRISKLFSYTCRLAWILLPLLHPLSIEEDHVKLEVAGNTIRIGARALTTYKTGVEMDVLVGIACCISALPYYLRTELEVESIRVERRVKQREGQHAHSTNSWNRLTVSKIIEFDNPDRLVELEAVGQIRLREDTTSRITQGKIEKGDVIEFSRACMLRNLKLLPILLSYVEGHCKIPLLQGAKAELHVEKKRVHARLRAKFSSSDIWLCYSCSLFSVISGLLSVWDMVKKYEKDESGQYRETEICNVRVTAVKLPPF